MAQDPKAKEPAAAGEAAPPKSKKKLIIIIAAVVVLLAGAGGGWYFMKSKEAAKKPAKHGEIHEEAEEAEGEHGPVAPVFLPLETFTVNLQPDPDEKFLQLDVSIQVKKPEEAEALKAQMPAIRNRLLMLKMQFCNSLADTMLLNPRAHGVTTRRARCIVTNA